MPRALYLNPAKLQAAFDRIASSTHLTEGYYVKALEDEVTKWCGMHAIAVNSAGSGLFTMMRARKKSLRRVAVCNNTFFATGAMAREAQAQVHIIDCNREDFCMSLNHLKQYAAETIGLLDGVIYTHVGGGISDEYYRIARWCWENNIALLEDAAHALGASWTGGVFAGSHGEAAVFSLYPTKAFPAGEGGIIVTKDTVYAERMREFRNYGKYVTGAGVMYRGQGFNFRMDEWTAAVAFLQLERRDEIMTRRNEAAERLSKIIKPLVSWPNSRSNWYKYIVAAEDADAFDLKRKTGKVYAFSDQLMQSMRRGQKNVMPNSVWVSQNHYCVPLDECLYESMSQDMMVAYLKGLR